MTKIDQCITSLFHVVKIPKRGTQFKTGFLTVRFEEGILRFSIATINRPKEIYEIISPDLARDYKVKYDDGSINNVEIQDTRKSFSIQFVIRLLLNLGVGYTYDTLKAFPNLREEFKRVLSFQLKIIEDIEKETLEEKTLNFFSFQRLITCEFVPLLDASVSSPLLFEKGVKDNSFRFVHENLQINYEGNFLGGVKWKLYPEVYNSSVFYVGENLKEVTQKYLKYVESEKVRMEEE